MWFWYDVTTCTAPLRGKRVLQLSAICSARSCILGAWLWTGGGGSEWNNELCLLQHWENYRHSICILSFSEYLHFNYVLVYIDSLNKFGKKFFFFRKCLPIPPLVDFSLISSTSAVIFLCLLSLISQSHLECWIVNTTEKNWENIT